MASSSVSLLRIRVPRPSGEAESGFSLTELLVVISVMVILTGIAVFALAPAKAAFSADNAANQLVNFMRDASARALGDRHSFRLVINQNTQLISIIDEKTISGGGNNEGDTISGDDVLARRDKLIDRVSLDQPGAGTPGVINPPPAPYNYSPVVFDSGVWTAHFQSDGSVLVTQGASLVPFSATFFFQSLDAKQSRSSVRAVTLFGPSGSVRLWMYDGSKFIAG